MLGERGCFPPCSEELQARDTESLFAEEEADVGGLVDSMEGR